MQFLHLHQQMQTGILEAPSPLSRLVCNLGLLSLELVPIFEVDLRPSTSGG